ncbi:MAG: cupin domain-containing protein [Chromatocurvus sp.]
MLQQAMKTCFLLGLLGPLGTQPRAEVEVIELDMQLWYEAEDRAVARELVSPRNSSAQAMSIAEIVVPPGVVVRPHHHAMEEVYHVLAGEGLMMVEDQTRVVVPGDSVVIEPHEWHNIRNDGASPLRMFVTCAPAWAPEHLIFERERMPEE